MMSAAAAAAAAPDLGRTAGSGGVRTRFGNQQFFWVGFRRYGFLFFIMMLHISTRQPGRVLQDQVSFRFCFDY